MTKAESESLHRYQADREREGLYGIIWVGLACYPVLFLMAMHRGATLLLAPLLLNYTAIWCIHLWTLRRYARGLIAPGWMQATTFGLGLCSLFSMTVTYSTNYFTGSLAARLGNVLVAAAMTLPTRGYLLAYHLACFLVYWGLQFAFPDRSEGSGGMATLVIFLCLTTLIYITSRSSKQAYRETATDLDQQGLHLQKLLRIAEERRLTLDGDVVAATADLQRTNQEIQQAIDAQIDTFRVTQLLQEQVEKTLSFQTVGKAAGAAAHDFNNILAVISCSLEIATPDILEENPRSAESLDLIASEIGRLGQVGREILTLSGQQILRIEKVAIGELLSQAELLNPEVKVSCDRQHFQQVLQRLLRNAEEARPGGAIKLKGRLASLNRYAVDVIDEGPGPSSLEQLFEAFYTTKDRRFHLGLGLSAARATMRQIGGDVEFVGAHPCTFRILLPVARYE